MQTSPDTITENRLIACHCCGLVQEFTAIPDRHRARCPRCHSSIKQRLEGQHICLSLALAGAMLYPFAIFMPIMRIEKLGHLQSSSIWSGCEHLLRNGYWFTGLIIVLCSIVLPMFKLIGLILISRKRFLQTQHRSFTYHLIELSGRWGMLDVMLVAILVAGVKLGSSVNISPGPGLTLFCICVVLSLCASAFYDPHMIWKNNHDRK